MPRRLSCFVGDLNSSQTNLIDGPRRNRRQSVSIMLNQRRKSVMDFFNHKSPETAKELSPSPSPEYLLLKTKLAEKAVAYKRRFGPNDFRHRSIEDEDDDTPYEAMGQVAVLSLISIVVLFAWLAEQQIERGWV